MANQRRRKPDAAVGISTTGHNRLIGQPHSPEEEGAIAEAEERAAELISHHHPVGTIGRPFNRRSPFYIAVLATAGVALTYAAVQLLAAAAQVFVLIVLALFLAIGLEPAVSWLVGRKWPRGLAVASVLLTLVLVVAAFLASALPPLVTQVRALIEDVPTIIEQVQQRGTLVGDLSDRLNLEQNLSSLLQQSGMQLASGVLGFGIQLLSGIAATILVLVLTAYFLADMPRIRRGVYRLFPGSRRPRAILLGDQILVKVGAFVLGNLAISGITGVLTFIWLSIFDIPYPVLLALFVALVDLIPVVGATIGGIAVALVSLSVSWPIAVATMIFYVVYQSLQGYLLVPPIIGRAVRVPAMVTAVAVLVGAAMLGLLGALIAIPVSAAVLLVLTHVVWPRLDQL